MPGQHLTHFFILWELFYHLVLLGFLIAALFGASGLNHCI